MVLASLAFPGDPQGRMDFKVHNGSVLTREADILHIHIKDYAEYKFIPHTLHLPQQTS